MKLRFLMMREMLRGKMTKKAAVQPLLQRVMFLHQQWKTHQQRIHKCPVNVPVRVHQGIQVRNHQGLYHPAQQKTIITTFIKVQYMYVVITVIIYHLRYSTQGSPFMKATGDLRHLETTSSPATMT